MALNDLDRQRMREALALAEHSIGLSEPNPRVGCVIGRDDGTVLGRGFTQQIGGPHAEVMALRDAAAAGADVRGATAWVTLEPCAHHGRTPPCCDALVAAGIGRVVAACTDPFPSVAGHGLARLRAAGVQVALAEDDLRDAAWELNIGFFSRIVRGRPWVRVKVACSLDGRTALPNGESQWITGPEARRDGHAWRRRAGMVLTGIGTVLADDPRLDVREVPTVLQPRRAVLDSRGRLPVAARIRQGGGLLVFAREDARTKEWSRSPGDVTWVGLPGNAEGGIDLNAALADLTDRHVNEVHIEAGARLSGAWIVAGLCDELLVYTAPMLLGAGPRVADLPPPASLAAAARWTFRDVTRIGDDLRLRLRPERSSPALWMRQSA